MCVKQPLHQNGMSCCESDLSAIPHVRDTGYASYRATTPDSVRAVLPPSRSSICRSCMHTAHRYPEYVQLSLSIPGGGALQGEQYLAKLRIDDDRDREECTS